MRTALLAAAFGLASLAVAACDVQVGDKGISLDLSHSKAIEEWKRSYTIASGGRLEVTNFNGAIEVAQASGKTVEIHATREARAPSDEQARELLKQTPMTEQVSPERVSVGISGDGGAFRMGRGVTVRYSVFIPAGLTATFKTQNGGVRLDNVDGRFEASTTNGGVTGRDVSGSITATTVNGGVQMGLQSITGDVHVNAVNGGIRLELPPSIGAQLEASTVNGGVAVDDAVALKASERSRQRVAGTINNGGPKISAQTTNGGVRVSIRARTS